MNYSASQRVIETDFAQMIEIAIEASTAKELYALQLLVQLTYLHATQLPLDSLMIAGLEWCVFSLVRILLDANNGLLCLMDKHFLKLQLDLLKRQSYFAMRVLGMQLNLFAYLHQSQLEILKDLNQQLSLALIILLQTKQTQL